MAPRGADVEAARRLRVPSRREHDRVHPLLVGGSPVALEKLLEAIVPEDIQAFIRAITTPEDYVLTRELFAERNIDNVKFRTKSGKRCVNAAKFRAWEAAPTLAERRAEQVITAQ